MSVLNSCWLQETPLHRAAFYGHVDVVRALIADGADVNTKEVCMYVMCCGDMCSCSHACIVVSDVSAQPDGVRTTSCLIAVFLNIYSMHVFWYCCA